MCNCDDNINSTEISSGPQGPTGATGPAPVITGTSVSNLPVAIGSTTFTTQADIVWVLGQRIRATNSGGTKVMEGPITSYTGTTLVINTDKIVGTGNNAAWNLAICGEVGATGSTGATGSAGATGATGVSAFTTLNGSTSLGSNLYSINVVNSDWMAVGQILYIESSGYYQVTVITSSINITVLDLLYTGNVPTFTPGSKISSGGVTGKNGFMYETVDGNATAATENGASSVLWRNAGDTGYEFVTLTDLKTALAALPPIGAW
jgi:hypothetical protein